MFTLNKSTLPLILIFLVLLGGCSRQQQSIPGSQTAKSISDKIITIIDGDTVVVLDAENVQHRIRLKGIDAPERTQAFYEVSRDKVGFEQFHQ